MRNQASIDTAMHSDSLIPFKRLCTEAEVAGLAGYLASPMVEYVTGQSILVDDGLPPY